MRSRQPSSLPAAAAAYHRHHPQEDRPGRRHHQWSGINPARRKEETTVTCKLGTKLRAVGKHQVTFSFFECGCGQWWEARDDEPESGPPPACPHCDMPPELIREWQEAVIDYESPAEN
jgi:hypothetical protein